MNDYKTLLLEHITKSPIESRQKKLWRLLLEVSQSNECEALYEAVTEKADNLVLLTTHIKNQLYDMQKNNPAAWQRAMENDKELAKIIEEEEE